jgi:hypothetical protein
MIPLLRVGLAALFALVAGCSSTLASKTDSGVDRPVGHDAGGDLGTGGTGGAAGTGGAPASPWHVEFSDGVTKLWAVWGSGPHDIYAVGQNGTAATILHSTGDGNWLAQTPGVTGALLSVWGSGASDVYVGGFGNTLLHSTGDGTWASQSIPQLGVLHIRGSSASDVYLTYSNSMGNVYHSTGNGTWSAQSIGAASSIITAVWAVSATSVYFAGGNGANDDLPYIVHGPTTPATETIPPLPDMYLRSVAQLWGSGPTDIYAVGNSNQILHSTGAGVWTLQSSPQGAALGGVFEDVWGSGPSDVYVVGDQTGVAHSTGDGVWTIDPDPELHKQPLGIWGSGLDDVYVVGNTIAHKKAAQ